MVAETPQDGLLKLWESIPEDLRTSGSYTLDALSSTVASLAAKAQESSSSQCEHKNELAKALGKAAWKSYKRLVGKKPRPFTEAVSDYRRWKSEIRNWAAMNGAVPGDVLAAAVLRNTTGRAKEWTLSKNIGQYSKKDGVPVSAAATLEAILNDMDGLFSDPWARDRALDKYNNARQGTRPILEHNVYFHNLVVELGYDSKPRYTLSDYIRSLRPGRQEKVREWLLFKPRKDQDECTLHHCMLMAGIYDNGIPAPKKKRRQRRK
ncbi:uncharacterized protein Triagg1_1733 [Trichoderma aggressivum f. europaeum]|uniref:Uncharacterized protein n=1 Tax=Trichoderma aggressivum f. europaeum TaxID=173218 RepID=A0AAE1M2M9_9HYPO|nr:hypothetical protein Triagg1_1733 [Trichoderma aggressivum f. europaeum]